MAKTYDGHHYTFRNGAVVFGPSRDTAKKTAFTIFKLIFLLMIVFSIVKILVGRDPITFSGLLSTLSNAPTFSTDWIKYVQTNFSETFPWGFQWLGSIVDFFTDLLSVSLFVSVGAANVITFILYFMRYLFF
ncbi:MAG: hypothetical protein [Inoviridae sp.]|nr:MAG: hypothetical protein [Inoviridae sp.]